MYNWQQPTWPNFSYRLDTVDDDLFAFSEKVGKVTGLIEVLPESTRLQTIIDIMVAEAIKTSEIEGEYLNREDVMSSIRNNLGLNTVPEKVKDKGAQGIGELLTHVRITYKDTLTEDELFHWHRLLFLKGGSMTIGGWRHHEEPMQVISGPAQNPKIHFEAPPSSAVPAEMKVFINWFNETAPGGKLEIKKGPVRAAIAHLYFESIHPFEDGNGRIGRAIAEKALSQNLGRPVLLSLSQTIEANRKEYYDALQKAQQAVEVTPWVEYFVSTALKAQTMVEQQINFTIQKARFFDQYKKHFNDRQLKVIKRMLDAGQQGFEGGMSARKYISLTGVSKATATRDLQELVSMSALIQNENGGGRSTSYKLNLD